MLKFLSLSITLIVLLAANPAWSKLLFYDDCEDKWDTIRDWNESNHNKGNNYAMVSSEKARAGSHSYKMYVQPFDENNMAATNCGLVLRGLDSPVQIKNFLFDTSYWVGFSVFVPSSYNWPDRSKTLGDGGAEWQLFWQSHGVQDSCDQAALNPPIGAFIEDNGYRLSIKGDNRECIARPYVRSATYSAAFPRGAWHDVVLNFKFSATSNGFYKMWINGKQVVNDSGMNCYKQSLGPNLILGPYGHMENATIIYYDEVRVGDANSSYAEVAPKGSALPSSGAESLEPPTLEIISTK